MTTNTATKKAVNADVILYSFLPEVRVNVMRGHAVTLFDFIDKNCKAKRDKDKAFEAVEGMLAITSDAINRRKAAEDPVIQSLVNDVSRVEQDNKLRMYLELAMEEVEFVAENDDLELAETVRKVLAFAAIKLGKLTGDVTDEGE